MNEYEVIIEEINPCGGERYANKQIMMLNINHTLL